MKKGGAVFPRVTLADCKNAFARWNDHNAGRLGAALAFYTLLSLAPLLLFVVSMIALVFGQRHAQVWILEQVSSLIGAQGASTIHNLMQQTRQTLSMSLAGLIGVVTLLFGASGVFNELHDGLNTVWDVHTSTSSAWKSMAKNRLFAFGMVLAIGFVMLVSLILSTVMAAIIRYFNELIPVPAILLEVFNFLLSIYVIACLFALIFKYVPDVDLAWREIWSGAVLTAVLFTFGKMILGVYLGMASVGSAYGAAGSLVAVVVWVYYSAQIFYYGAEVTWVHSLAEKQKQSGPGTGDSPPPMTRTARA
jgi:membrane protein